MLDCFGICETRDQRSKSGKNQTEKKNRYPSKRALYKLRWFGWTVHEHENSEMVI